VFEGLAGQHDRTKISGIGKKKKQEEKACKIACVQVLKARVEGLRLEKVLENNCFRRIQKGSLRV
jgi:hypothetical protein